MNQSGVTFVTNNTRFIVTTIENNLNSVRRIYHDELLKFIEGKKVVSIIPVREPAPLVSTELLKAIRGSIDYDLKFKRYEEEEIAVDRGMLFLIPVLSDGGVFNKVLGSGFFARLVYDNERHVADVEIGFNDGDWFSPYLAYTIDADEFTDVAKEYIAGKFEPEYIEPKRGIDVLVGVMQACISYTNMKFS